MSSKKKSWWMVTCQRRENDDMSAAGNQCLAVTKALVQHGGGKNRCTKYKYNPKKSVASHD